ncbi:MAG: PepSY domain-containing protein [Fuerstiella sp.]
MIFLRRVHLYAGLFLLPWVFLYGITGAMFNHVGLFPEAATATVDASQLTDSAMKYFPSETALAEQVVAALQAAVPDRKIVLNQEHRPEFANEIILQVDEPDGKHVVHIDPMNHAASVMTYAQDADAPEPLLPGVNHIDLDPSPYQMARDTVPVIMNEAGISATAGPQPRGWSKLNFLASVDGKPARITYVLRDGHVDVTRYDGDHDMSLRGFLLRLHTSHGSPPHWNGRAFWSLLVDVMAIAMVTWGLTGLVMWWQVKRTRLIGSVVIVLSLTCGVALYFSMVQFYATTKL